MWRGFASLSVSVLVLRFGNFVCFTNADTDREAKPLHILAPSNSNGDQLVAFVFKHRSLFLLCFSRKREVCSNAYECWMKRKALDRKLQRKEWNLRYKFIQKCQRDQKKMKKQLQVLKDIDEMGYMYRR